jgi:regulation of enolase protein 1 (concanavalin A-like superfamily)
VSARLPFFVIRHRPVVLLTRAVVGVTPGSRVTHLQKLPGHVHANEVAFLFIIEKKLINLLGRFPGNFRRFEPPIGQNFIFVRPYEQYTHLALANTVEFGLLAEVQISVVEVVVKGAVVCGHGLSFMLSRHNKKEQRKAGQESKRAAERQGGLPSMQPGVGLNRLRPLFGCTADCVTHFLTFRLKLTSMTWYNKPTIWSEDKDSVFMRVEGGTDFWRITHYDFIRDTGHFYYREQAGDFVASVKVTGQYKALYDQAGLMLRLDAENWIKAGIEYVDELQNVSAVVTRQVSDWSVSPQTHGPESIYLRLTRQGDSVRIDYSFDDFTYQLLRLAYFSPDVSVQVGLMAAAPDGNGFDVVFEQFALLDIS